jgi:ADP-ribosyl-[dinitrogen reductase] hydrolase
MTICKNISELWQKKSALPAYDPDISTEDRIIGSLMGYLIGDALGVGCHWYYHFEHLWEDFGDWIDDYHDPIPNNAQIRPPFNMANGQIIKFRYNQGVRAGFNSQSGQLGQLMMEQLVQNIKSTPNNSDKGFVRQEYKASIEKFWEQEILPNANFYGETKDELGQMARISSRRKGRLSGMNGRFTDTIIRGKFDIWYNGGKKNGNWSEHKQKINDSDTSEIAQLGITLAAIYRDPEVLIKKSHELASMWFTDSSFISQTVAYIMAVQALINGTPLADFKYTIVETLENSIGKEIQGYDDVRTLFIPLDMMKKPQLYELPDDRFYSVLYGHDCLISHLIPCALLYAFKYCNDFETGILMAINGGGNNMARAALTGGLLGAMTGIQGIPKRFIKKLANEKRFIPKSFASQSEYLLDLAKTLAKNTQGKIPASFVMKPEDYNTSSDFCIFPEKEGC